MEDPEEFSARVFGAHEAPTGRGLELAPFRGVRFDPRVAGGPAALTAPPYDLVDQEQLGALRGAGGGHNVVRLTLPQPPGQAYGEAAATLRSWLDEGVLTTDPDPALYLYEASRPDGGGVVQRGLIGALGLRPESDRVVLPHENVYPGPVRDRLALMAETGANLEPIFLIHEGGPDVQEIIDTGAAAPPLAEYTADGLTHRLWRLADPSVHARVAADLRPRRAMIADGHHRYATYRALQARHATGAPSPWDHGLALLVDSTRYPPHLGAIHRVLPGLDPGTALAAARTRFRATGLDWPDALGTLARTPGPALLLAGGDRPYLLTDPDPAALDGALPPGHSAAWRALDTAVLDHLLIDRTWRVAADERTVEVVHDDPEAALARARRTGGTAVLLAPLDVRDVLAIADAGERVPRKSTSFAPKPPTGLVLRLLAPPGGKP